jgi:hypothetical protein
MKFHIYCNGDMSVNIPGCHTTLDWPELDNSDPEYTTFVKDTLKIAFIKIFDDRHTVVMTDEEFEKYTKED